MGGCWDAVKFCPSCSVQNYSFSIENKLIYLFLKNVKLELNCGLVQSVCAGLYQSSVGIFPTSANLLVTYFFYLRIKLPNSCFT